MNPFLLKQVLFTTSIVIGVAYKGMKLYNEYKKAQYYNSLKDKEHLYDYARKLKKEKY